MSRLTLRSLIRIDGAVLPVSEALDKGLVIKGESFHIQNDETHGNIIGLRPRWTTQRGWHRDEAAARRDLSNYRGGARILKRVVIQTPDGGSDWGHLSQSIIN